MLLSNPTITPNVFTDKNGEKKERFLVYGGRDSQGHTVKGYRATMKDAQELAERMSLRASSITTASSLLTEKQMFDAAEAIHIIKQAGLSASLVECAKYWTCNMTPVELQAILNAPDALSVYVARMKGSKHSSKVNNALKKLLALSGDYLESISKKHVEKFLAQFKSPKTKNLNRGYVIAFLNWCLKNNHCSEELFMAINCIDKEKVPYKRPAFMSAKDVLTALRYFESLPDADMIVPKFAIGFFAGVRSEEIDRMDWKDVSFENFEIRVEQPKGVSGTPPRIVSMSSNLDAWLSKYRKESGRMCYSEVSLSAKKKMLKFYKGIDMTSKDMRNVARHTFATMHCAMHRDFELTASEMGHGASTVMLMKHYKSITGKKEAEEFWDIYPL